MDPAISFSALRELLRDAIKAVPAVRYALGVAGIGAAAAIVFAAFQQRGEIAVIGTAIMIAFMVVLLVFATLSRLSIRIIQYPAILLLWVTIVCFCAMIALLTTSFFFSWPVGIHELGSDRIGNIDWEPVPGPKTNDPLVRVTSTNLPVADEITALLSQTSPKTLLRIALPNIAVQPADQQPAANAVKELIALHLQSRSIVVSEAEIVAMNTLIASQGIDMVDVNEFADAAKKAAVDVILKMKMFQVGSSQYVLSVTPIVVAEQRALDSLILEKGSVDIARANEAVAKLVDQIMKSTRSIVDDPKRANGGEPRADLSISQLDQLSRARTLLQQGRLVEAQPIYAQALGEQSTEWQSEADYAALMNNLGMSDWVQTRLTDVLKRVPSGSWCDRAALLVQKTRAFSISASQLKKPFAIAREAVTSAAACGDIATTALALHYYAYFSLETDVPLTLEANRRARSLLDKNKVSYEWLRCQLDFLDTYVADQESRQRANASAEYVKIAEQCEKVGNLRTAAIAYRNAVDTTWHPDQRLELLARSIAAAAPVGGSTLDDGLLQQASSLRDAGRKSDADVAIIHVIQTRVSDLVALHGNLPEPLDKLDSELLSRLTLTLGAPRKLSANEKLLSEVHRGVLVKALRLWAKRTDVDSRRLALTYLSVADQLGADGDQGKDVAAIEQRLARTGLPFDALSRLTGAPLRSDGINLKAADSALWDLFFALRKQKEVSDELMNRIVVTAAHVSSWRGSPSDTILSLRMAAYFSLRQKRSRDALDATEKAKVLAKGDPGYVVTLLSFEADELEHSNPDQYLQMLDQIVQVSEGVSPQGWVAATYNAAMAKWRAGKLTPSDGGRGLENVAESLLSKHVWDAADAALVKAAQFYDETEIAVGTSQGVAAQGRRLKFEATRASTVGETDSLRVLTMAVDVLAAEARTFQERYRGRAPEVFRRFSGAIDATAVVGLNLNELASMNKFIDAARVVTRLPYFSPDYEHLASQALDWARHFEESSDYPIIVGDLHLTRGEIRKDTDVAGFMEDFVAAKQNYLVAKAMDKLGSTQSKLIRYSFPDEGKIWPFVEECMSLFRDDANKRTFCHDGLSAGINDWPRAISDPTRTKIVLADGLQAIATEVDKDWAPIERYDYRSGLSWIALLARDFDSFNKLNEEIRRYYTDEKPNPYQWVTHLSRAGSVAEAIDPKLAVKLYLEFDHIGAASQYWIADAYSHYAAAARNAGDAEAEQLFVTKGRGAALQQMPQRAYLYDIYALKDDVIAKNWARSAAQYSAAIATLRMYAPGARMRINDLKVSLSVAQALNGDLATADQELSRQAEWAKLGVDEDRQNSIPCYSARILELASSTKFALNLCEKGRGLHEQAATVRSQCQAEQCYPDGNATWCDAPSDDVKLAAACGQPFNGDPDLVLQYWK